MIIAVNAGHVPYGHSMIIREYIRLRFGVGHGQRTATMTGKNMESVFIKIWCFVTLVLHFGPTRLGFAEI